MALAWKELCGVEIPVRSDADVAGVGGVNQEGCSSSQEDKGPLEEEPVACPVSRERVDLGRSVGLLINEHLKRPPSPGYP